MKRERFWYVRKLVREYASILERVQKEYPDLYDRMPTPMLLPNFIVIQNDEPSPNVPPDAAVLYGITGPCYGCCFRINPQLRLNEMAEQFAEQILREGPVTSSVIENSIDVFDLARDAYLSFLIFSFNLVFYRQGNKKWLNYKAPDDFFNAIHRFMSKSVEKKDVKALAESLEYSIVNKKNSVYAFMDFSMIKKVTIL